MATILNMLKQYNYSGQFIYRNNVCNAEFHALEADERVEMEVRQTSYTILNAYSFSICRGVDLFRDKIHFDYDFALAPPEEKPSLGELSIQIIQSLLNGICNPLLFHIINRKPVRLM